MSGVTSSDQRSPVIELGVRTATPLALVVALYLFFAGHNRPGGGFAAGLVIGAVVALRMVAGMAFPARPGWFLAAGSVVAGLTALAPLLWGDVLFDQIVVESTFPILGKVKSGTALVFDAGVVLIVVGLVIAVLDGLGADELGTTADDGEEGR
jgi:multicomponent Na+:H+ antiporter subunit A